MQPQHKPARKRQRIDKMSKTLLPLSLLVLLSACSAISGPTTEPIVCPPPTKIVADTKIVDTSCDWSKPIYVDDADIFSNATADAIRLHNETGAKKCNWKPHVKKGVTP